MKPGFWWIRLPGPACRFAGCCEKTALWDKSNALRASTVDGGSGGEPDGERTRRRKHRAQAFRPLQTELMRTDVAGPAFERPCFLVGSPTAHRSQGSWCSYGPVDGLWKNVVEPEVSGETVLVELACADDDAQGQPLTVFWDYENSTDGSWRMRAWADLAAKGFDSPRWFAAFYNTMRWNCSTATDSSLFQAPFRAGGITIDAYQMEPLRKALRLPRVNLFIADDTGLGKTIEAGLIARELLLRRKVKAIVVATLPSVLEQWKGRTGGAFRLGVALSSRSVR